MSQHDADTSPGKVTRQRLIKAGYKPGFDLDDALAMFQPEQEFTDAALEDWVKYNRPKSQTKERNRP